VEDAQTRAGGRQFGIHAQRLFQFCFRGLGIIFADRENTQREVERRLVAQLPAPRLNLFAKLLAFSRRQGRLGDQPDGLNMKRIFGECSRQFFTRPGRVAAGKMQQGKHEMRFRIVRRQLFGPLQEREGPFQAALLEIDRAEALDENTILRVETNSVQILDFRLVVLLGGIILVAVLKVSRLARPFGTSRAKNQHNATSDHIEDAICLSHS
jgi:hypothetical protein